MLELYLFLSYVCLLFVVYCLPIQPTFSKEVVVDRNWGLKTEVSSASGALSVERHVIGYHAPGSKLAALSR